jgi:hypothetical protein
MRYMSRSLGRSLASRRISAMNVHTSSIGATMKMRKARVRRMRRWRVTMCPSDGDEAAPGVRRFNRRITRG